MKNEGNPANCRTCKGNQGSDNKIQVINHINGLSLSTYTLFARHEAIVLQFPELNEDEKLHWQKVLLKDYTACGCTAGAYFLIVGFAFTIVLLMFFWHSVIAAQLFYFLKAFVIWVASAMTGKIMGWLFAKARLAINAVKLRGIIKRNSSKLAAFTGY